MGGSSGPSDDYYKAHNSWSGSSGGPSDDYYKAHNSWSGSSGPFDDYYKAHNSWSGSSGPSDDYYKAHNSWSGSGSSDDYYKAHNSWSGSSGGSSEYQQGRSNSCACVCKSDPCNHDPFDLCSEGSCCGVGTHFVNGACVATYDGMLEACKIARGKQWAWTCEPSCSKK